MAMGSALAILMVAVNAAGYDLFSQPMPWALLFGVGAGVVTITLHVDKFVEPAKWDAWRASMENATVWDFLRFRHIPDLRSKGSPGV